MSLIMAIDQGTTGTTVLVYDLEAKKIIASANREFKQHYPKPSWVEHDLNEIWNSVEATCLDIFNSQHVDPNKISAIGITNQRETTCVFSPSGEALAPAIVWQDKRTHDFCEQNRENFSSLSKITGLPLDPYFSSSKLHWLINNNSKVIEKLKTNDVLFGTIDTYLLYKLTNHTVHATEPSNASRTNLYNLKTGQWDTNLINFFKVSGVKLPEIKNSFDNFGTTKNTSFLPDNIPILCMLGDQQAALFGQGCINEGELKCTYGTGAFLLMNTESNLKFSNKGLLTTVAYAYKGKNYYALEGSSYIAGAAVQWLRDNLNIINDSSEIEQFALKVHSLSEMEHILFYPYFSGIGSPFWKPEAKASLMGLTRDTNKFHIARACLEGINLSINDLIEAFGDDLGCALKTLKVDGGAVKNNLLMQMQANFSQLTVVRPKYIESTAMGVILGAIIELKQLSINKVKELYQVDQEFTPVKDLHYFNDKKRKWKDFLSKTYL
jgi:glycerol kinase